MLTGVHNFAIKKIELDAKNGIYYIGMEFQNLLPRPSKKMASLMTRIVNPIWSIWNERNC